jgi:uncharacterized protein YbjT (DUF2867 family)
MRAVVAGATGYLGGFVVRAFAEAGWKVRALARNPDRCASIRPYCDEIFQGEATVPDTLHGLFRQADVCFSSIGIRHVHRRPTFWEVDCQANLNLVEAALRAGAPRFVFVSVFRGDELRSDIRLAEARERVADRIRLSKMKWIILRPTGFFNDMEEFFRMAQSGKVWLPGDGSARLNPVHGADIASHLLSLMAGGGWNRDYAMGGPDVLSLRQIGEMAFHCLRKEPRFGFVPGWVLKSAGVVCRPFNANASALLQAFALLASRDGVAPSTGDHRLKDFFAKLAQGPPPPPG